MVEKKKSFFGLFKKNKEVKIDDNTIVTPTQAIINNFKENKLAVTGVISFILILLFTFVGPLFVKFNVLYSEPILANISPGTNFLNVPSELNGKVKKIQSGISFTFALDTDGKLYHWGQSVDKIFDIPKELKDKKIEDIAVSDRHILALTKDGTLVAWGSNDDDEAQIPESENQRILRVGVKQLFAGPGYSGVILNNNQLISWGVNNVSQRNIPLDYLGRITSVYPLQENMLMILDDGTVDVTGTNILTLNIPKELKDGSVKAKKIVGTYRNALVLSEDGKVISWGGNGEGLDVPKTFDEKVVDIQAGYNSFTVVLESGKVVSWGDKAILGELDIPNQKFKTVYSQYFQSYGISEDGSVKAWGLKGYLLGSDELGRDIFTRLMYGGQTSLLVGIIAVIITTFIGLLIGLISGFVGGKVDNILMRFGEIVSAIPFLPLLITLSVVIGQTLSQDQRMYLVMVLIGLLSWVGLARLVRGQILIEREKDFVLAARALGIKENRIILKHILPSVLSIAIVSMTLSYGGMMLTEAGLSFLGFGVLQPTPTWGNMLNGAQKAEVIQLYWWRWVFPALAVFITVLSVNLIGDGLRDAVDPKSNEK